MRQGVACLGRPVALHLVRHGPPVIEPHRAACLWQLDARAGSQELQRLGDVLARRAPSGVWHSSDEPKAVATARSLTTGTVQIWPALREAGRSDWFETAEQLRIAVLDAFDHPARSARPGWEPLHTTRRRISSAVAELLLDQRGDDVILVGHGTAWTLLVSELTGGDPDLPAWTKLRAPDLCTLDVSTRTVSHGWGAW